MDIDNRVSTRIKEKVLAQWGQKNGQYRIVLNLAGCWTEAVDIINRGGENHPFDGDAGSPWNVDDYFDAYCDVLSCSYLVERICIERSRQRIRLKRNHCKPCCLNRILIAMHNHVHNCFTYTEIPEEERGIPGNISR